VGKLPANSPAFDSIDWANWQADLDATLLFVVQNRRILLIEKKRGLGAGKLNGAGGKVDPGETVLEAAIREFEEELLATPLEPAQLGRLSFAVTEGDSILIHVFRATGLDGEPTETDEAVPVWADVDDMPYDRMWEDDRYWLPLLLEERAFEVRTLFDGDRMLGFELEADPDSIAP
jgi:8-oxo-dGTP diphosphatase